MREIVHVVQALVCIAIIGLVIWGPSIAASATRYQVTTFDAPFPGAQSTVITGINPAGTWLFQFLNDQNRTLSSRKPQGAAAERPIPWGLRGLNRSASSVGTMLEHYLFGFLATRNEFITIECLHSPLTEAAGLNDANIVVGDCLDEETDTFRSFRFDPATREIEVFDVPWESWSGSGAQGINNAGVIVGGASESGYMRDVAGNFTPIHVPGTTHTLPRAINNHGMITGITCNEFTCQCFTRSAAGRFALFAVPGALLTDCTVGTDTGRLAGWYIDAAGIHHGFVAHPQ